MKRSTFSQYLELTKPKVVLLIVFTALVGMLLSVDEGLPPIMSMFYGLIGIGFAASSAAAINHWADQKIDAIMLRTQHRPLPSGELNDWNVIIFAFVLCAISMTILILKINLLTAVLTFFSLVGYAFIYTFFLKRVTPQNIVIGGAAGAAPPVLGWTAITGNL
ncbi:MAG: UbiA family prenyltransferase, partial [Alcanivoracaceae bacterium]|nr:UbiA family prenyltransferase [Alcanivoracaceae bacterium]